ncbi:hypothetical protein ACF1G0_06550 [Streptomyces sp. NPDC013953]|uniref:hypothetical protein n=1 Tax=Streptomyces sp. NPDC013953 TaxID=3364868 RepID=UPI0036FA6ECE
MHDLIRAFAAWARLALLPGAHARHRSGPALAAPRRAGSPASPPRLPAARSPYGIDRPLDGSASALVRPYLVAYEQGEERTRQRQRRLALVLAADFGVDLDTPYGAGVAW